MNNKDAELVVKLENDQVSIKISGENEEIEEVLAHAMQVSKVFEQIMLNALKHFSEDNKPDVEEKLQN